MKAHSIEQLEGYTDHIKEIEVLQKYGNDRTFQKGQVMDAINMLHPKSIDLKVSRIIRETDSTSTLRLIPKKGYLPPFQAGQYINLFVQIKSIQTSRPYSISSSPSQTGFYDITIRRLDNGFVSSYLTEQIKVGDSLTSTSPTGNFYHNPLFHGKTLVFLAGGSGITPFMSMIREVTDRGLDRQIHLIYGSRIEDDIVFHDELADRSDFADQFKVSHVISEASPGYKGLKGFITKELIQDLVGNLGQQTFYICGPPAMSTFVSKALKDLVVPVRQTRKEIFGPPVNVTQQPGWPEAIRYKDQFDIILNRGRAVKATAGEPLMNSLERAGLVIPASCRSGDCSLCRTKVLKGKVYQPPGVKLRKSDRKYNYIHPCMAYPLEDLELLV
jgi:glycine betaine catabolism B